MPIIPQWYDDEKTIFLFHFTPDGISSWEEYRYAIDAGLREVRTVAHPVVIYFDPDEVPMPSGNPLHHLRYALGQMPDNTIAVVNIVNNRFAASILRWLTKIGPYQWFYVVKSAEEAEALIERILAEHTQSHDMIS